MEDLRMLAIGEIVPEGTCEKCIHAENEAGKYPCNRCLFDSNFVSKDNYYNKI